jgi:hypothetical protein
MFRSTLSPCLSVGQKKAAEHPFIKGVELVEDDWYSFSRSRHPKFYSRNPETIAVSKAQFFNKTNAGIFFVLLKSATDEYKFPSHKV